MGFGELRRREQFVGLERCGEDREEEVTRRDGAPPPCRDELHLGIERNRDERQLRCWVGMRQRAADGPALSDHIVPDCRGRVGEWRTDSSSVIIPGTIVVAAY